MRASIKQRLGKLSWEEIEQSLWGQSYALTPVLLTGAECAQLVNLYEDDSRFRSRVVMERLGFGRGEYKYFRYPLPEVVSELRELAYPKLSAIANRFATESDGKIFPEYYEGFLARCKAAGQTKPTPLLLKYGPGDYNCLHQDLYGEVAFPLQVTVFLSRPGVDYRGGEFVLVEQRPRMQSRAMVITPQQGQAVIFPTRYRAVRGRRGVYRTNLRHGVSSLHSGSRFTLGIIFHDAR
jgi:hypothetical protein